MARRAKKNTAPAFPWSDQLILFRYFLDQFGENSLASLSGRMNRKEYEGVGEDGNTHFFHELDSLLQRQGAAAKLSRDMLKEYDEKICRYVKQIGKTRGGIRLKYFQYMACLFTEMYLNGYFLCRDELIAELNAYAEKMKKQTSSAVDIELFTAANMNKLAFMCATGSGKTLIMHINILQFQHYLEKAKTAKKSVEINKIILLAPNEGMANQHLEELRLSNISAEAFVKGGFGTTETVVSVIDMNKLKEEGKEKTVSVDSFEQNNLVLVDEAHRGLAGDVWYDYRSRLSAEAEKGGFAFEYSATLKQAMKSNKPGNALNEEWKKRLDEYFRSIIIDYSYKFFYGDGYGKEYRIYNLRESIDEEQRQLYLVGCLLSFYQQLKLFTDKYKEYTPFQIEKPLLVFVGNRVTAKTSKDEMTDVEEVLDFIDTFVNRKEKTIGRIHAVLNGNTGLMDGAGCELFSQNFNALSSLFDGSPNAEDVYKGVLRLVFNSDAASDEPRLHVLNLRRVSGEIALRIGTDGEYFGVISIGDTTGLIQNCEAKGIVAGNEEFASDSLFRNINAPDSNIKVLVGSRKFTEGWNSWRVSTMGLINFAKGEGSQAIQLFGRGVRLRGYNGCLKRSRRLDDRSVVVPRNIELLETLTIFGIKAQYMEDFKKYLEKEDMPPNEKPHEYTLPVLSRYTPEKHKQLRVIKVKEGVSFKKQAARLLLRAPNADFERYLNKNKVLIDCRSKVQTLESTFSQQIHSVPEEHTIPADFVPFLDFDRILDELETYKNEKFYYNISMSVEGIAEALNVNGWYALIIPKQHITPNSMEKLSILTDFAVMVLKSYLDKLYKYEKDKWEAPYLEYRELEASDDNFVDEYTFSYFDGCDNDTTSASIENFVNNLTKLMNDNSGIPATEYEKSALNGALIAFDFRSHLYAPLIYLQAGSLKLSVSPVSLNEDEKCFVDKLKEYVEENTGVFQGKNLYLLRNKSKVGMGFFEAGNFYPDFVLWIDEQNTQYISFIDPKGLMRLQWTDPKIEFSTTIKGLQSRLQPKNGKKIVLNSFIISGTSSADLEQWWEKTQADLRAKNVFCLDKSDCVGVMIAKIFDSGAPDRR